MNAKFRVAGFIAAGALAGALATIQVQAIARNAVAPLDNFLRSVSRSLEFRRDASGTIVVTVRDLTTGEVIRQCPEPSSRPPGRR